MIQPLTYEIWVNTKFTLTDFLKKSYAQFKVEQETKNGNQPTLQQVEEWGNNVPEDAINIYKRVGYAEYLVNFSAKYDYLTFTCVESGSFYLNNSGTNAPSIQYNKNNSGWTSWDYTAISMEAGDVVKFKGENLSGFSSSNNDYSNFAFNGGKYYVTGNVMSLIDGKQYGVDTIPCEYCFFYFTSQNADNILSAPMLTATATTENCYTSMFMNCPNIEYVQDLMAVDNIPDDLFKCGSGVYEGSLEKITCGDYVNKYDGVSQYWTIKLYDGTEKELTMWDSACFAKGTKITMADGSLKNIEDIEDNEYVMTFNHETGEISSGKVIINFKSNDTAKPLILHFSNGTNLSIIGVHSLLEQSTLKYVRLSNGTIDNYIGKKFYNATDNTWYELLSYEVGDAEENYYSIYSDKHINSIANGFLSVPDDQDYVLNIYELDNNLKADAEQLKKDIEKYGLTDIEKDYPEYIPYKETMYAMRVEYCKIAIGKGLITKKDLIRIADKWYL